MLSVRMLMVIKTYQALRHTVGLVLLCLASIASTLYLCKLAFVKSPFNKARQQMMQWGLVLAGFLIIFHLSLALKFYTVMNDLRGYSE